ncbi:Hypothetical_protein [Hexamita inflata]|uniref:Hypothetical_protein n=1 Tax=Hexamita inflata TaxID=28002 RepID=A0ABP1GW32_9EUKA
MKIRCFYLAQSQMGKTCIISKIFSRFRQILNGYFAENLLTYTRSKIFSSFQNLCKLGVKKIVAAKSLLCNMLKESKVGSPQSSYYRSVRMFGFLVIIGLERKGNVMIREILSCKRYQLQGPLINRIRTSMQQLKHVKYNSLLK